MNSQQKNQTEDMQDDTIKLIFTHAEEVAGLHAALSSPRGEYFKRKLLNMLSQPASERDVEALAKMSGVREYKRHIHKLVKFGLVEQKNHTATSSYVYRRTYNGEEALNVIRELEGKFGPDRVKKLYEQSLGKNSIRLFLKIYGSPKELTGEDIIYTPLEMGQISSFLPRTIEGIAAIDKLDDAGLVSYLEDGNIHVNPRRSTVFYHYLTGLYKLFAQSGIKKE